MVLYDYNILRIASTVYNIQEYYSQITTDNEKIIKYVSNSNVINNKNSSITILNNLLNTTIKQNNSINNRNEKIINKRKTIKDVESSYQKFFESSIDDDSLDTSEINYSNISFNSNTNVKINKNCFEDLMKEIKDIIVYITDQLFPKTINLYVFI